VARYLAQLDTADRQEPSEELAAKTAHLKEKLVKLDSEMQGLAAMESWGLELSAPEAQAARRRVQDGKTGRGGTHLACSRFVDLIRRQFRPTTPATSESGYHSRCVPG